MQKDIQQVFNQIEAGVHYRLLEHDDYQMKHYGVDAVKPIGLTRMNYRWEVMFSFRTPHGTETNQVDLQTWLDKTWPMG